MRAVVLIALALAAFASKPTPAKAEIFYPWCLKTDTGDGADNCSFDSFEQCKGSTVGAGGICVQNIWYTQQHPQAAAVSEPEPTTAPPPAAKKKPVASSRKPNQ